MAPKTLTEYASDPLIGKATANKANDAHIRLLGFHPISEMPADGTWAVLWPGYYGSFMACAIDGEWTLCEESDLETAVMWTDDPFGCVTDGEYRSLTGREM